MSHTRPSSRLRPLLSKACIALPLLALSVGCRPSSDDPPTKIDDPAKELEPARKKAKENEKKKKEKKRAEADAKKGKGKGKADAAQTKPPKPPKPEPTPAAAVVGKPAPDFTLKDLDGNAVKLSSYAGKTVVLEWFNPQCPFVKYAHGEGPLKQMAKTNAEKGVVWLSINSGAPGKQGHGLESNRAGVKEFAMQNPVLTDESGEIGRMYGAKTTPHMYVVNPKGELVYAGALDNAPRGQLEGEYEPWAQQAIDAVVGGNRPARSETKPYGCSVKYEG